jgi:hypothetical protein
VVCSPPAAMKITLSVPLLFIGLSSAQATTLMRADLDLLAESHSTIVLGEVIDAYSYWSKDGTMILTDVRIAATEILKGDKSERELTVTLMGGTVGELTTLIVGGAILFPGRSYVLFLNEEDLPGASHVLTVREHCQGVFDLVPTKSGLRAISQANGHPLVADHSGKLEPEGGEDGIPLADFVAAIQGKVRP